MNVITLGSVKSQKVADAIVGELATLQEGGGKRCFDTDFCPNSAEKTIRINFLPDVYTKVRQGYGKPNTDHLSGFVKGLLRSIGKR